METVLPNTMPLFYTVYYKSYDMSDLNKLRIYGTNLPGLVSTANYVRITFNEWNEFKSKLQSVLGIEIEVIWGKAQSLI